MFPAFEQEVFAYKNWIFAKLYAFLGRNMAGGRKISWMMGKNAYKKEDIACFVGKILEMMELECENNHITLRKRLFYM